MVSTRDFRRLLAKHFRLRRRQHDCLPYLVTPPERDDGRPALAAVLAEMGAETGVEVGVREGRSAICWLTANPKLRLTCIDPWMGSRHERNYPKAVNNLAPYNAQVMRATSMEGLAAFTDESLDFVHIDGNHEFDYVAPDIIYWSRKLKRGGVIVVHDYLEFHKAGVVDAVRAYTHCHHIDPWYVTRDRLPTAFWQKP